MSYLDGVCVKISEKYKPPKRINSLSYSQRLALNKLTEELPSYDFGLEESVKSQIIEWRNLRSERPEVPQQPIQPSLPQVEHHNAHSTSMLIPTAVARLEGVPLPQQNRFNYREFEADTSSPFDLEELKTLNDMEELAMVLKPERNINGAYAVSSNYRTPPPTDPDRTSVQQIVQNLQQQLRLNASSEETVEEEDEIKPEWFPVVKQVISMGFPKKRVVKVCQIFEGNQKKMVEHLLALSDILDLGFQEETAMETLLKCDNDRDKALDLLIT